MLVYKVLRPKDMVYVAILKNKADETYSFINLSKEHICPCKFKSIEDALLDLDNQVKLGNVISYSKYYKVTNKD